MSLIRRPHRIALVILVLLLAAVYGNVSPDRALAANDVDTSVPGTVKITVNIEFAGAATQSLIDKWAKWIEDDDFWGADRSYSCLKVVIKANFKLAGQGDQSFHTVNVVDIKHGRDYRSSVRWFNPYRPNEHNVTGSWGNREDQDTIAHEFGHVLGLIDEYDKVTGQPNPNIPGSEFSLMGKRGGNILDHHIKDIVRKHVDKTRCEWKGSGSVTETPLKDDYRELTRSTEFEFAFAVDKDGNVSGEITLTYDAVLTVENLPGADVGIASFDPEVGGQVTDPNPTRTYPLTGKLEGDELTLEIATAEEERELDPIEFTIIADPGVSAGLGGGGAFTAPGGDVQIIEIDMTPFTPFEGPATVVVGPDGPESARYFDQGDNYEVEWNAEVVDDSVGEPVS